MYQKEVFEMKTIRAIWKHSLFQVHQVLVNQDSLQKICSEELNTRSIRVSIQFILLQRQRMESTYIIDSVSIRHKMWQSWWHRCNIIWFQEFPNRFDGNNITKISSTIHKTSAWVSHYAINYKKQSKIRNWAERVASQSSVTYSTKRCQGRSVSAEDLIIDLTIRSSDNRHNRVNFSSFKHYPDDNKKSQWKKAASKEITMKEFQSDLSKEKRALILSLGL